MNNKIIADLHMHSIYSDGKFSCKELVDTAISKNLSAIALSDHDSVKGIDECKELANGQLQIISAIELSSEYQGKDLHILGYNFDYHNPTFLKEVEKYQLQRTIRAKKIVQNLNDDGININYNLIEQQASKGAVGRPHIARALIETNIADSFEQAFDVYLNDSSKYYEPKYYISPEFAINLIKDVGGITTWAHPRVEDCLEHIDTLKKMGLNGIEIYHPCHNQSQIDILLKLATEKDLLISGGSDFHGHALGPQIGDYGISQDLLNKLLS